jgi:hypothetical protein
MDQANNKRLTILIAQGKALESAMRQSVSEHTQEFARYESFKRFAEKYNLLARQSVEFIGDSAIVNSFDTENLPIPASLTWPTQKQIFDSVYAELLMLVAALEGQYDYASAKSIELKDFFESSLRRAVFAPPATERELQDVIEQLLIGRGFRKPTDYDRETGRVKYSGKEFVPDFIYLPANMFIEAKLVKTPERAKIVVEEINSDILAYKTRYSKGMFIVYDVGTIRDASEFVGSIEQQMDIAVCLVKH